MSLVPNPELIRSIVKSGVRRLRADRAVTSRLSADVIDDDDEVTIRVDAPGVEEEDIQVRYLAEEVLVRMDRFRGPRDGFDLVVAGRAVGFDGRVPLPDDVSVEPESGRATLRADGTLEVRLPKESADAGTEVVAAVEDEPAETR